VTGARRSFWGSCGWAPSMLTKDILFGMNILTLAGFVVMGITLTLNRMGQAGKVLRIGLDRRDGFGIRRVVCGRRALVMDCPLLS
jgi:hypothetical protein